MKNLIVFFLFVVAFQTNAQEFSQKYGQINLQELTFKKYPKDTNAEAVVIYDLGKSYFYNNDRGFSLIFERSTKIRIITKAGVRWGEVEIPYYYEGNIFEDVDDIEAFAYNFENGAIRRTKLEPNLIYDEKLNEFWRLKKFAIPDVKEGSVVEYKYIIRSPYLFNLRDWEFQRSIPTIYSEYITRMIPFYEYTYIMQGKNSFDVKEVTEYNGIEQSFAGVKYNDMMYRFGMKDVPAFNDESFITSPKDYICKLDFQLAKVNQPTGGTQNVISTWPALCNDLLKESSFGRYCNSVEKSAKEILPPQVLNGTDKLNQLESIVNLVKESYSWNGNYGKYASKTLKEFQKDKTGNVANINLYLAGLLKGSGFEAYPVLISTRGNGAVYSEYPFLHFFNYVVVLVKVDNALILTDATEPLCSYDRIPSRCLNNVGLVIKKDAQDWVKLVNQDISRVDKKIQISLDPVNDTAYFKMNESYLGYESFDMKMKFKNDMSDLGKSYDLKGYHGIDSLSSQNFDKPKEKYNISYKGSFFLEHMGSKLYVSPFLNEPPAENPLKQTSRTYPVDFTYPFGRVFNTELRIPAGYKVEFVPQPLTINNPFYFADYKVNMISDDKMLISGSYSFKNAVYEAKDYKNLKFVYNEIIKKFNERIVLVKI